MWDESARSLLLLIVTALLGGGGIGLWRILRFQRRDAADAQETSSRINASFGALLDRYEARDVRLSRALEECEQDRIRLMRADDDET